MVRALRDSDVAGFLRLILQIVGSAQSVAAHILLNVASSKTCWCLVQMNALDICRKDEA